MGPQHLKEDNITHFHNLECFWEVKYNGAKMSIGFNNMELSCDLSKSLEGMDGG